jgi:hypothetical protein
MDESMTNQYGDIPSYAAWRNAAGPGVIAFGMWLRVGFIGASAVAVGLIQLFSGDAKPLSALGLATGGLLLALLGWWRARKSLGSEDDATVAVAVAADAAPRTHVATT